LQTNPPIIVTGGAGLIGSQIVERLAQDFPVVILDRERPDSPPAGAACIEADVTSDRSMNDAFEQIRREHGEQLASVIHLAAYYDFSGEPSDKYQAVTVEGTRRLCRILQSFRAQQLVFSSTMLVHAPCGIGERIDENSPIEAKWDYPKSKVRSEQVIREERGTTPATVLRIAGVYDDQCHSIPIAHQIQRIYERDLTSHVFPGDPAAGQAFVHMKDLVESIRLNVVRGVGLEP
jgi:nucleoside-diphosphate-sugar epimerase